VENKKRRVGKKMDGMNWERGNSVTATHKRETIQPSKPIPSLHFILKNKKSGK